MRVSATGLPEVLLVEPELFGDARGFFVETFSQARYEAAGIAGPFVQDNLVFSRHGVLRGLHLQNPATQGKLLSVLAGEVFDAAVDVRVGSPRFGQWVGHLLSSAGGRQPRAGRRRHGFEPVALMALPPPPVSSDGRRATSR